MQCYRTWLVIGILTALSIPTGVRSINSKAKASSMRDASVVESIDSKAKATEQGEAARSINSDTLREWAMATPMPDVSPEGYRVVGFTLIGVLPGIACPTSHTRDPAYQNNSNWLSFLNLQIQEFKMDTDCLIYEMSQKYMTLTENDKYKVIRAAQAFLKQIIIDFRSYDVLTFMVTCSPEHPYFSPAAQREVNNIVIATKLVATINKITSRVVPTNSVLYPDRYPTAMDEWSRIFRKMFYKNSLHLHKTQPSTSVGNA